MSDGLIPLTVAIEELLGPLQGLLADLPPSYWRALGYPQPKGHNFGLRRLAQHGLVLLMALLQRKPEEVPLRQALGDIAPELKPALRQLRGLAVLEYGCGALAEAIGEAVYKEDRQFHEHEQRRYEQMREELLPAPARIATPFRYNRRPYLFPYRQLLLLECLRAADGAPVDEVHVAEHIWSSPPPTYKTRLRKLQQATNATLRNKHQLPLTIKRPAPRYLQLLSHP
jgi:hypothetical protein